jgi:hypothetical protein
VPGVKAKDQAHKIGSLFLNPGGPGGSGTRFALGAPQFLSDSLLHRFDVVGIDPRGIGSSAPHEIMVRCGRAGSSRCAFAGGDGPLKKFAEIARALLTKPLVFRGQTLTYADFVAGVQGILYDPAAGACATAAIDDYLLTGRCRPGALSAPTRRSRSVRSRLSGRASSCRPSLRSVLSRF